MSLSRGYERRPESQRNRAGTDESLFRSGSRWAVWRQLFFPFGSFDSRQSMGKASHEETLSGNEIASRLRHVVTQSRRNDTLRKSLK